MRGPDKHYGELAKYFFNYGGYWDRTVIVVLEEQRPFAGVDWRSHSLWLDGELITLY